MYIFKAKHQKAFDITFYLAIVLVLTVEISFFVTGNIAFFIPLVFPGFLLLVLLINFKFGTSDYEGDKLPVTEDDPFDYLYSNWHPYSRTVSNHDD